MRSAPQDSSILDALVDATHKLLIAAVTGSTFNGQVVLPSAEEHIRTIPGTQVTQHLPPGSCRIQWKERACAAPIT